MSDAPPATGGKKRGDAAALPIARRLVRATAARGLTRFPLLWRREYPAERLPMVGWYDPLQLLDAGIKSLVSNIVGERSDQRIVQALANRRPEYYDYTFHYRDGRGGPYVDATRPREEIWIDYVCDTGDGWNSDLRGCVHRVAAHARRRGGRRDSALPAPARRPAGLWRRRGLSDPQPRRVSRPADRPLGDGGRRRPPRRVATRVRDPRQPRLVRRPQRLCATLLLQRRRASLRGLAYSPAPQLLRPEASLPLVADRVGRTAAGGYRHAPDRILPGGRRSVHAARRPRDRLPGITRVGAGAQVPGVRGRVRRDRPPVSPRRSLRSPRRSDVGVPGRRQSSLSPAPGNRSSGASGADPEDHGRRRGRIPSPHAR